MTIFMSYPSVHIKTKHILLFFMNIHTTEIQIKSFETISRWPLYVCSVYGRFDEMERLYWLFFSHHDWIIAKHPAEKQRERLAGPFIMWLFGATVQTTEGLRGPISLSIHSFIGSRWFPPSRPLRGPHLITDHHSHLACVPFQLSAQFLSDDSREPQAHWPRLESSNRSFSRPSHLCAVDPLCDSPEDPFHAHSDPEWKADDSWHVTWRATYD